jgi:DNA repair protein RadD
MILRPYQDQLIEGIRTEIRKGRRRILAVAPTGAGKTVCFAAMTAGAASKGLRTWVVVHRIELVDQALSALREAGADAGAVASGMPMQPRAQTQVCSVQTIARRHERLPKPDVIIVDEAHHAVARTWSDLLDAYPAARVVGFTATPIRLDGRGLGEYFDAMVVGPDTGELIEAGHLTQYMLFEPTALDLSGVNRRGGDYAKEDVAEIMAASAVYGDMVKTYLGNPAARRAVVFTVTVAEAHRIVAAFNDAGVPAAVLEGGMDRGVRNKAVQRFRDGELLVLATVDLISEGFDLPAMDAVFLGRPTASLGLYRQQVGRVLRTYQGKETAWIYDHVGNVRRHGFPDMPIQWELTRNKMRMAGNAIQGPPLRTCRQCFAVFLAGRARCPHCGAVPEVKDRKIERIESEMREIVRDPEQLRLGFARTVEELRRMMG